MPAAQMASQDEVYIDPAFEFDAPRFYDFQSMEPESPSDTDVWFDTEGPQGERIADGGTGLQEAKRT